MQGSSWESRSQMSVPNNHLNQEGWSYHDRQESQSGPAKSTPPPQGPRLLLAHCVSLDMKLLDSYVSCSEDQL